MAILLLPPTLLAVFLLVIIALGAWEWSRLSGLTAVAARSVYVLVFLLLAITLLDLTQLIDMPSSLTRLLQSVSLAKYIDIQQILGAAGVFWAIGLLWVKSFPASVIVWGASWMRLLMGLFILVPMWLALVNVRGMDHGSVLLFILLGIVSAADTGAYFSGRAWGKAKLAPNVSPAKSWAGFWGGLAFSFLFCLVIWLTWSGFNMSFGQLIALSVITALASVLGDLLESMVKRHAGIKDSGHLLPGHGGFMDRMDSMSAAAPIYALILVLVA